MSSEKTDTRTRILDAAWRMLESGDRSTRMADIAMAVGISRQALYLHFPKRADLLVATTRHIDQAKAIDVRLAESRTATGAARLEAFVAAWGDYIPEIHGVSAALRSMQDRDPEARRAWDDRMAAVREGCAEAVRSVAEAGRLRDGLSEDRATDLLWALLSVETWERLIRGCGWTQEVYRAEIMRLARAAILSCCPRDRDKGLVEG